MVVRELLMRLGFQVDTRAVRNFGQAMDDAARRAGAVGDGSRRASQGLQQVGQQARAAAGPLAALASQLKGLVAGYLGYQTFMGIIASAGDFEKSMNRVGALTQETGARFKALEKQAIDLGKTTSFSASQAADAMGFLSMAGFKQEQILGAMPHTLNLAASAQVDLATAADITSNILSGYGMQVHELAYANDVLVKAFTSSNTDLRMLGESFKYAGPIAKAAGVDFAEAAAAIGFMGDAGIQASMAGTGLRGIISNLLNVTPQQAKIMQRLDLNVKDTAGNMLPLADIVEQLGKSGANVADILALFGDRAGPAMQVLIDRGSDALRNQTKSLKDSGGIAKKVADRQLQGYTGAVIRMKSALEGLSISIGSVLLPKLADMAEQVAVLASGFAEWIDKVRQSPVVIHRMETAFALAKQAAFVLASFLVGKMITGAPAALQAITSAAYSLRGGLMAAGGAAAFLNTMLMMGVGAAVLGVILVIQDLYTYLTGGESQFEAFWSPFVEWVDWASDGIQTAVRWMNNLISKVRQGVTAVAELFGLRPQFGAGRRKDDPGSAGGMDFVPAGRAAGMDFPVPSSPSSTASPTADMSRRAAVVNAPQTNQFQTGDINVTVPAGTDGQGIGQGIVSQLGKTFNAGRIMRTAQAGGAVR